MLVFSEVSRRGSFTEAADVLGLTKSGVSQYVSQLEAELGVQLLTRTTRRLVLTQAGLMFVERCRQLENLLDLTVDEIEEREGRPKGPLSITAPHALAPSIIIPAIGNLVDEFPGLEPRILIDDRPSNIVDQGIDLAIRVGDLEDSTLRARLLGEQHNILVASPSYLANNPSPKNLSELSEHPFIATSWQQGRQQRLLDDKKVYDIALKPKFRVNTAVTAAQLATAGKGFALLPNLYLVELLAAGQLVRILPQIRTPARLINSVHSYRGDVPLKVRRCIDLIKSRLEQFSEYKTE
ncbi:hypothetical protein BGP75_23715 [Motiliproteus sp. MSK22-1]|nr:hypothetical protein BGP75_23715 [Motiliproteus sp. MSK22-1]